MDENSAWYRTQLDRNLLKELTQPSDARGLHRELDKEVILEPIALNAWDYLQWFTFNFKKFKMIMFPNIAHFFGNTHCDVFFRDPLFPPGDNQQHLGLRPNVPDWRICCHTTRFDPLMAFLYWQMNYHIEHHMYAAVPFWNLPRLHAAKAYDTPQPRGSYLAGIRRILWIQKQQKRDPSFCFLPELPPTASPPKLASM